MNDAPTNVPIETYRDYEYIKSETRAEDGSDLWTVGRYGPSGKWHPESDWDSEAEADARAARLNDPDPSPNCSCGDVWCGGRGCAIAENE